MRTREQKRRRSEEAHARAHGGEAIFVRARGLRLQGVEQERSCQTQQVRVPRPVSSPCTQSKPGRIVVTPESTRPDRISIHIGSCGDAARTIQTFQTQNQNQAHNAQLPPAHACGRAVVLSSAQPPVASLEHVRVTIGRSKVKGVPIPRTHTHTHTRARARARSHAHAHDTHTTGFTRVRSRMRVSSARTEPARRAC
jgi:hypothetical protein